MKKFMSIYAIATLVFVACGDEEDEARKNAECSITLNGGPYNNYTAKINEAAMALYIPEKNRSIVSYFPEGSLGGSMMVVLTFPGRQPGEYTWDEDTTYPYTVHTIGDEMYSGGHGMRTPTVQVYPGVIKITEVTDDGVIRGTFSGTMRIVKVCGIEECDSEATVEGSFVATSN